MNSQVNLSPATFSTPRKLVADYSSGSDSSSDDTVDVQSSSETESSSSDDSESSITQEAKQLNIEELHISLPSEKCEEFGKVKFVVENQVIVESKSGLAPLDLGTVLFLNKGENALGAIDETFGPVSEPLYIVLFPSAKHITTAGVSPGTPVYYAPTTEHTSYVFLPDLLKMRGSDASWKHNQELPPELQDNSGSDSDSNSVRSINERECQTAVRRTPRRCPQPRGRPSNRSRIMHPELNNVPYYPPQMPQFNSAVPPPPPPQYYSMRCPPPFPPPVLMPMMPHSNFVRYGMAPFPMEFLGMSPPPPQPHLQDNRLWRNQSL